MDAESVLALLHHESALTQHWVVAFSGGADSLLLLSLCADVLKTKNKSSLTALYLHHYSNPIEAERRAVFDKITRTLTVLLGDRFRFVSETADIEKITSRLKYSWEHTASLVRRKRLALLSEKKESCRVMTGHNLSDYYETLALRRKRKIPQSAWPPLTEYDPTDGTMRPLARLDRKTVRALAQERSLLWYEDPANADTRFLRNTVRQAMGSGAQNVITITNADNAPNVITITNQNAPQNVITPPFLRVGPRELRLRTAQWTPLPPSAQARLVYTAWKKLRIANRFTVNDFNRARLLPFCLPPYFVHHERENTDNYIVFRRGLGERINVVASLDLSRENENCLRGDRVTRSLTIQKSYGRKSVAKIFSELRLSSRQRRLTWVLLTEDKKNALQIYFPEGVTS